MRTFRSFVLGAASVFIVTLPTGCMEPNGTATGTEISEFIVAFLRSIAAALLF